MNIPNLPNTPLRECIDFYAILFVLGSLLVVIFIPNFFIILTLLIICIIIGYHYCKPLK